MGDLVQLPTAAKARHYMTPARRAARAKAIASGSIAALPAPWEREFDAQEAKEREILAAGGVGSDGPSILAGAILAALEPIQQKRVVALLTLGVTARDDARLQAALTYAWAIVGRAGNL